MLVLLALLIFADSVASYSCSSDTACIFVDNQCPFALYLQRTSIDGDENLPTTVTTLATNQQSVLDIDGWNGLPEQRLYAWWQNPIGLNLTSHQLLTLRDKVEINWYNNAPNQMCYNPTAVDYFGLPVMIGAYHTSDCSNVAMTGAYHININDIEADCPTKYIKTSPSGTGVCVAPQHVCLNSNDTKPICSHLDPVIKQCQSDKICSMNVTSRTVYACSEELSQSPQLCAALNRGMYAVYTTDDQSDSSLFYKTSPYNEYAKFIHRGGAKEYAFPYDDWKGDGASGYETCSTNFMSVTFCPESPDNVTSTLTPTTTTTTNTTTATLEPSDDSCASDTGCILVDNQCPFPLYIQRSNIDGDENIPTSVTRIARNNQSVLNIGAWNGLPGQRLYAWWQNPIGQDPILNPVTYRDKVDIHWCSTSPPTRLCYNPTAMDYFGLPVKIGPYSTSSECPITGQYNIIVNTIKDECPTEFIETYPAGVCLNPSRVCYYNSTKPMCSHLDSVIKECIEEGVCGNDVTTTNVYGCGGSLGSPPDLCAALNRGIYGFYGTAAQVNESLFYQTPPYNNYAAFVHRGGAKEIVFNFDNYRTADEGGWYDCTTNFLSVTFCPGTPDNLTISTVAPTVNPTEPAVSHKTKKYDIEQLVIGICAGCAFGVVLTLVVMLVYKWCKRMRNSLNEELLESVNRDNPPAAAAADT